MRNLVSVAALLVAASVLWAAWFFGAMVWRGIRTGRLDFKKGRTNPRTISLDRQTQPGPFWVQIGIFSALGAISGIGGAYAFFGTLYQLYRTHMS